MIKPITGIGLGFLLTAIVACQTSTVSSKQTISSETIVSSSSFTKAQKVANYGEGLFFSYPFKTSDLYQIRIMKAQAGKLVYRDGCLSLFNGTEYVTPVFPNAVTTFDKQNQTLEMLQVKFNMQDMIMAGGYQIASKDYLEKHGDELVTQAPERCLLDEVMVLDGVPDNKGRVNDGLQD